MQFPFRALLLAGGLSLAAWTTVATAAEPARPRLVVVISIDQFPYRYLEQMRSGFDPHGMFLRLTDQGANYTNCLHGHAFTYTAPGHSVLLTGAFPNTNGIIGNEWYVRDKKRSVYCVEDTDYPIVGNPLPVLNDDDAERTSPKAGKGKSSGISPRTLLVDTLGDVLKLVNPASRVFGVALKDRAGVLMAGHAADGVYWFDTDTGHWITSKYYRDELPGYLRNYNEGDAAEAYAGKSWELLHDKSKYMQYSTQAWSGGKLQPKPGFPHSMPTKAGSTYYKAMTVSPFGNQFTLETAKLVLEYEKLGQDDAPDILAVNLSSNDYVGHAYGPHSLEVQDITYRTDRLLADFADFVEKKLGGAPWVLALSSDHGVAPVPEYAAELKLPAVRDPLGPPKALAQTLDAILQKQLGDRSEDRPYVLDVDENSVYLNRTIPELRGERYVQAQRIVRDALLEQPHVAMAFIREELIVQDAAPPTGGGQSLALAFQRAFNPKLSGDVVYALTPYSISGKSTATHGSPWEYDRHVPLLFWGAGIKPGRYTTPITPAAIAPTFARLLGINPPAGCAAPAAQEALAAQR